MTILFQLDTIPKTKACNPQAILQASGKIEGIEPSTFKNNWALAQKVLTFMPDMHGFATYENGNLSIFDKKGGKLLYSEKIDQKKLGLQAMEIFNLNGKVTVTPPEGWTGKIDSRTKEVFDIKNKFFIKCAYPMGKKEIETYLMIDGFDRDKNPMVRYSAAQDGYHFESSGYSEKTIGKSVEKIVKSTTDFR